MTDFAVWAPTSARVHLRIEGTDLPMRHEDRGWWRTEVPEAKSGTDYAYLLGDGGQLLPDPRSWWQPYGVPGLSRADDHGSSEWTDTPSKGRQGPGGILHELQI